ncbi:hypothetical protein SNEBB_003483 [Seison nebaliae]|nr:hypothetical protein SNEBB_003483 [Seison nebaliae]
MTSSDVILSSENMSELTAEQLTMCRHVFSHWDSDSSGYIKRKELEEALLRLADNVGKKVNVEMLVSAFFDIHDRNDDDKISLEEFLTLSGRLCKGECGMKN